MIWIILLLPLLGSFLNGFVLRNAPKAVSHAVGVGAMLAAFALSVFLYWGFMSSGGEPQYFFAYRWLEAGDFVADFQFILDRLSGLMLLVITGIGSLIHIYAGGYLHEEKSTSRFFSYLNLFVFMMLLLVLGDNLLIMFIGWEGVGLCSYLLIGYWYHEDANAAAGMKAFLVNRIGDIGFLLGIFLAYTYFGTVSFSELKEIVLAQDGLSPELIPIVGIMTFCLFVGATGKSAQIPLYVWLPDAMAGPTPVSALIHAATMVTAGVYMMTRLNFLFYLAPTTMNIIALVGGATALFAATIALVQNDIKKVLAYSTVSQLGYMVMACGVGAFDAGVFHLLTHACFKALLFLGAGSVIVAMHHKQDMLEMGGLRKYMPMTHGVFVVGVLAIIGFPGLSGFFSKDEILWKAYMGGGIGLWLLGAVAAGCTSFYMVRLLCLTFYGDNRSDHHTRDHLKETGVGMWGPLVVLAVLSAGIGYLGVPHVLGGHNIFASYLAPVLGVPEQISSYWSFLKPEAAHDLVAMEWTLMGSSVGIMLIAALTAIVLYKNGPAPILHRAKERAKGLHQLLSHKYFIDEIYFKYIVNPLKDISVFLWKFVDVLIIDGLVNGVAQLCALVAGLTSFKASGSVHRYGMLMVFGLVCLVSILLV